MKKRLGIITGIWGPMGAGKSSKLFSHILEPHVHEEGVQLFQPPKANRGIEGEAVTRLRATFPGAISANYPRQIRKYSDAWSRHKAIEEVHFYGRTPAMLQEAKAVILELRERGHDVYWTGLLLDFRGNPFPLTKWLIEVTDRPFALRRHCAVCRRAPGHYAQRLILGHPAPANHPLFIPDTQFYRDQGIEYEARCINCYIRPGQPSPHMQIILKALRQVQKAKRPNRR